jgi:hypothetical protein
MSSSGEQPGVHVSPLDDGRMLLRARLIGSLTPSVRPIAWVLAVAGLLGLGGLAALHAPVGVHALFAAIVAVASLAVYWDALRASAWLEGDLVVDAAGRRLVRRQGLDALRWSELTIPVAGEVVVRFSGQKLDTRSLLGRTGERCTVSLVGAGGLDAAGQPAPGVETTDVISLVPYDLARAWGEALSRALGWPVVDLASAHPERRDARDIDRNMEEHRAQLARALPEARLRRPFGAAAWRTDAGLTLRVRTGSLSQLLVDAALGVPLLFALLLIAGGNVGAVVFGVLLFLLAVGGRTQLELTPDRMVIHTVNLWLPLGGEVSVWWTDVEQVQVVADRGRVGLRIATARGSTFVPTSSRAAARWVAAHVRRFLLDRSALSSEGDR